MVAPVLRREPAQGKRADGRRGRWVRRHGLAGRALGAYPPPGSGTGAPAGPARVTGSAARPRPRIPISPAWQIQATSDPVDGRAAGGRTTPRRTSSWPPAACSTSWTCRPPQGHGRAGQMMQPAGVGPGPVAHRRGGPGPVLCGDPRRSRRRGRVVVLPPGLRARGRGREVVGLRWHCRDSYVLAPPSRYGAGRPGTGPLAPAEPDGRPLPDAAAAAGVPGRRRARGDQVSGSGTVRRVVQPAPARSSPAG